MVNQPSLPWRHDSNKTVSGKPDAVQFLDSAISTGDLPDIWTEFDIAGGRVRIVKVESTSRPGKRIWGYVDNKEATDGVLENAKMLLADRLETKDQICRNLKWPGERWLALFNNYGFADEGTYQTAYRELNVPHGFSRVFLVLGGGDLCELGHEK